MGHIRPCAPGRVPLAAAQRAIETDWVTAEHVLRIGGGEMITFHPSASGGEDYLDFHDSDGTRYYLPRDEARYLAQVLSAADLEDVTCGSCGRVNGVHMLDCPTRPAMKPARSLGGMAVELDPFSPQAAIESWRKAQE